MLKQSLQLRIGQQLTLTPQLQQAIRLLQLSTLELQTEIQQALESNVMLEEITADEEDLLPQAESSTEIGLNHMDRDTDLTETDIAETAEASLDLHDIADESLELTLDTSMDDLSSTLWETYAQSGAGEDDYDPLQHFSSPLSLYEALHWQVDIAPFNEREKLAALWIIDYINPDGYLTISLPELLSQLPQALSFTLEELENILLRIQGFDPVGVGARSLAECLQLQLQNEPPSATLTLAQVVLAQHLPLLAAHDYPALQRKLKVTREELQSAMDLIAHLNPKPGQAISNATPDYIIPDVFVYKKNHAWQVSLNPEATPQLRINPYYMNLMKQSSSSTDQSYLKNHLQEARWFINSLQSRYDTLLKVASCIVEEQQRFFEEGEESMRPLILRQIAGQLHLHESTISRATTQKYMHTPRGTFEFKYFFSSQVHTDDGNGCSSTAIRALMKKLIAAEDVNKPLSDHKIAQLLSAQGINVARRTVAKYREAMSIAPSNERKRPE